MSLRVHADAGIDHGKDQTHARAIRLLDAGGKHDRAVTGEFHRIVDQVLQRRAQPQRIAGDQIRQIGGDGDLRLDALVAGAGGEPMADGFGEHARRERLVAQDQAGGAGPGGIDDQAGEIGEMIGAALDGVRPFALARAEIGGREQFGERGNAGERRADVMRDAGEHGFQRARRRRLGRRPPAS